jgi:multiple sugar transport system ATP-binding protein
MNLYVAELERGDASGATLRLGSSTIAVPAAALARRPGLARYAGKNLVVGIRPEDISDPAIGGAPAGNRLRSTVELVEALGSDLLVHFGTDAVAATVESSDSLQELKASARGQSRMIARLPPRSEARLGAPIEVAIDAERLHFFDAETGEAIWA